jgi:hypothetical protein
MQHAAWCEHFQVVHSGRHQLTGRARQSMSTNRTGRNLQALSSRLGSYTLALSTFFVF